MEETKSDEQTYENVRRYPTCWRVSYYVHRILIMLLIGVIALPLSFYLNCHYYQKKEKAICRGESDDVLIILICIVLVWWPMDNFLFYFARQYVKKPI